MKHPTPQYQLHRIKIRQYKCRLTLLLQGIWHKLCYWYHHHITCFDRAAYSLRLLDVEFLLKAFGVIGSVKLIQEVLTPLLEGGADSLSKVLYIVLLIILVVAFFLVGWAMVKQAASWKKNVMEVDSSTRGTINPDATLLTEKYADNGYEIMQDHATNKYYIMSPEVNRVLYEDRWRRHLCLDGEFLLPIQCALVAPYFLHKVYREKKTRGTQLYLSNLIGLMDDVTAASEDAQIRVMKTNYFDFMLTNETVNRAYLPVNEPGQDMIEGYKLLYNQNGTLRGYSETLCADVLGGSTLAVTNDGYVIMQMQSGQADRNPGTIVPSGSGSTDYSDFIKLQTRMNASPFRKAERPTFQQLIIDTIHRELSEENGFDGNGGVTGGKGMRTRVIGFARLLDRGAKPDFFGVTYIDAKATELYPQMNESLGKVVHVLHPNKKTDREISRHILIPYEGNGSITAAVRNTIENVLRPLDCCNPSLQTGMLLNLIDSYYEEGIDLFDELQREIGLAECSSLLDPVKGQDGFGFSAEGGFAYVIDGASDLPGPGGSDLTESGAFGAWELTTALKAELDRRLPDRGKDLLTILLESILAIGKGHPAARSIFRALPKAGEKQGPSAAVTIIRLNDGKMEYYSLGDCTLSVKYRDGSVGTYANKELVRLDNKVFHYMQQLATADPQVGSVRQASALPAIEAEKLANRNLKNESGGYWILDLSGAGIPHGTYRTFNPHIIESLALMTDGTSDLYNLPKPADGPERDLGPLSKEQVHEWLMEDPTAAVEYLKEEYEADADWEKYPRFKALDDITVLAMAVVAG